MPAGKVQKGPLLLTGAQSGETQNGGKSGQKLGHLADIADRVKGILKIGNC